MRRDLRIPKVVIAVAAVALTLGACVGVGVETYEEFRGAVEAEASCAQLIEISDGFDGSSDDKELIERDLRKIGCTSQESRRSDI